MLAFLLISAAALVTAAALTDLPDDCQVELKYRGYGTQNYICDNSAWKLFEPVATLHQYISDDLIDVNIAGRHFFQDPGETAEGGSQKAAAWEIGDGCNVQSCRTSNSLFLGKLSKKEANGPNNIDLLLVERSPLQDPDGATGVFAKDSWLQRLSTLGGKPPSGACESGAKKNVPYESDYFFGACGENKNEQMRFFGEPGTHDFLTSSHPVVTLPDDFEQTTFTRGFGTQEYMCIADSNGEKAWQLIEPKAWLHKYDESRNAVNKAVDGRHFFASPGLLVDGVWVGGSGASWSLGGDCSLTECADQTGTFKGKLKGKTDHMTGTFAGNIKLLLVEKVSSSGDMAKLDFLQRLDTVNGVAGTECDKEGDNFESFYESDYVFSEPGGSDASSAPACISLSLVLAPILAVWGMAMQA